MKRRSVLEEAMYDAGVKAFKRLGEHAKCPISLFAKNVILREFWAEGVDDARTAAIEKRLEKA